MPDFSSLTRRSDHGLDGTHKFTRRASVMPAHNRHENAISGAGKKMTIGRDIKLAGRITSCDCLMVEGEVEANFDDGSTIEIAHTGSFKGLAVVDTAIISGRFEGDLTVRKLLLVYNTGRVTGNVRYGQIEIESGAEVSGDVQKIESDDISGTSR
jgi:cytoskeletal protein CcmA (bactofilin family)